MELATLFQQIFVPGQGPVMSSLMAPGLIWLQALSSLVIGLVYCIVPAMMLHFMRRRRDLSRWNRALGGLFFLFIASCGLTHFMEIVVLFVPMYSMQTAIKLVTAVVSLATLGAGWYVLPKLLRLPSARELQSMNQQLQQEIVARQDAYDTMERHQHELEDKVCQRTAELTGMQQQFEIALRGDNIILFSQDKDLRYKWITGSAKRAVEEYVGRTDFEMLDPETGHGLLALKQRTLATGQPQAGEVFYRYPHTKEAVWFRLNLTPIIDGHNDVTGLFGVALDITATKAMEQEQIRLSSELSTTLQRYQVAMQSTRLIALTQDRNLIYTAASRDIPGWAAENIVGQPDDAVLPPAAQNILRPYKKRVLDKGTAEQLEVPVQHDGQTLWFDTYLTPLHDAQGQVSGLTCAMLDITERKSWEEHLRLLMREVTHRSKNLLAVIQAMARQTARHADSLDKFVERFSSRLQALGSAHDLLVQESWHGVNLHDLAKSQLGHYVDLVGSQIDLKGPQVFLAPEAAQNLGMALHEMATNAAKYGALSTPKGHVGIDWRWTDDTHETLELNWYERGGPAALRPERTGFGTHVIERNVTRSLGAKVRLEYTEDGFRAHMLLPAKMLLPRELPLEARLPAKTRPDKAA